MDTQRLVHDESLTRAVMRRVYLIWFAKRARRVVAREGGAFAAFCLALSVLVSMGDVFSNLKGSASTIGSALAFLRNAFLGTEFSVQITATLATLSALWLLASLMKTALTPIVERLPRRV